MLSLAPSRRLWRVVTGLASLALVALIGVLIRHVPLPADIWIVQQLYAAPGTPVAAVATVVTGVATFLCVAVLVAGGIAVWRRNGPRAAGFLARSVLLMVVCGSLLVLQNVILRPGPPQQPQLGTYPSSHAIVITSVAFVAVLLCGSVSRNWRRLALVVGVTAVVLVSAGRVVLAEHWLVDVVAGIVATVGVCLATAAALRLDRPATRATT